MSLPAALDFAPVPRPLLGSISPGLRYMAYGAFWFSLMSLLVKLAGQRLPSIEIVLARALITLALSWWLLRRARLSLRGRHPRMLLLRGLLGAVALACFYFSLVHLPLAEATVIQYTNPIFTAVLAGLVLGERLGWRQGACVAASLFGVLLIARPASLVGGTQSLNPTHVWIALAGAMCSASAYVTVRKMGTAEHPLVIVFYFPLVTVPLALPFVIPVWTWPTAWEWLILAGIGVTTQIAQVYMTRGLQLEPAGRATAVGYLQIVFAALWGAMLFAEWPDSWSVAGAVIILGSTLALTLSRPRPEAPGSGAGASPPGEKRTAPLPPDPADAGAR
jgi:drug/metabolite transporter (DMT)-like permease